MPLPPLGFINILGQQFNWPDLLVVGLLVLLEGLLSIDNALVLGLLAKRLPKNEQGKALCAGGIERAVLGDARKQCGDVGIVDAVQPQSDEFG